MGPRARRLLVRAALAAAAGLAAIGLAEAALRAVGPARDGWYVWPPGLVRVFRPAPGLMPGIEGPSRFEIGPHGLRGDPLPPDAAPRILCVGGSTTECLYLDQDEAWPALVQDALGPGAWVGNAGESGRHTRDHVVQLEVLLPRLPVDRVVLLEGVNDLMLPLARGADYDPHWLERPGARTVALHRAFQVVPREHDPAAFPRDTALWRLAVPALRRLVEPVQVQDAAGEVYRVWRAHRAGRPRTLEELPDLAPALDEYRRNLGRMLDVCLAQGARPLVLTQPALWRADLAPEEEALLWMGGVGDYQRTPGAPYYAAGALAAGLEAYNRVALEVAAERGVDALDLAALVPRDTSAFYDDVHFNEAGARLVAEQVAAALAE